MPEFKRDESECGALWIKAGPKGEYLTGEINGVRVVAFRNDRKVGQQPDYRVKKAKARAEDDGPRRPVEDEGF